MKKISVIVPIYNVEQYLDQCIDSIVNQEYKNLEIILVDDGSPDSCPSICDKWEKKDKRIKVIHKTNGGLSDARNVGIEIATGEYIGFVDSDDYIKKTMYASLLETCQKYKAKIACCGRILFNDTNELGEKFTSQERIYNSEQALKLSLIGECVDVAAWDKLYDKTLFDNIRFPVGENNEDTAIYYKLIDQSGNIAHTGTSEYYYRCRSGSITQSSYKIKDRINIFKHLDELEKFLLKKYPNLLDEFQQYRTMNIYFLLYIYMKNRLANKKEGRYLKKELKKNRKYLLCNNSIQAKDKIIALGMCNGIYEAYLNIKYAIRGE